MLDLSDRLQSCGKDLKRKLFGYCTLRANLWLVLKTLPHWVLIMLHLHFTALNLQLPKGNLFLLLCCPIMSISPPVSFSLPTDLAIPLLSFRLCPHVILLILLVRPPTPSPSFTHLHQCILHALSVSLLVFHFFPCCPGCCSSYTYDSLYWCRSTHSFFMLSNYIFSSSFLFFFFFFFESVFTPALCQNSYFTTFSCVKPLQPLLALAIVIQLATMPYFKEPQKRFGLLFRVFSCLSIPVNTEKIWLKWVDHQSNIISFPSVHFLSMICVAICWDCMPLECSVYAKLWYVMLCELCVLFKMPAITEF